MTTMTTMTTVVTTEYVYTANNGTGGLCLDILKEQWSPALNVTKVR